MTEAALLFRDLDQIPLLFGPQDRFLRQVRDAVGVEVTLRGDEIRLHGTEDQIKNGLAVFGELRAILDKRGELSESEVQGVLGTTGNGEGPPAQVESIDLFEKARRIAPRTHGQSHYVQAIREN